MTGGKFANGAVTSAFLYATKSAVTARKQRAAEHASGGSATGGNVAVDYNSISTRDDVSAALAGLNKYVGDSAVNQAQLRAHITTLKFMQFQGLHFTASDIQQTLIDEGLRRSQWEAAAYVATVFAPVTAAEYVFFQLATGNEVTPQGFVASGAVGKALTPLSQVYIRAAGGGAVSAAISEFYEFWIGVGATAPVSGE